jgi:hypothetical protein
VHVDNSWQDVFARPGDLDWADTGIVGIGIGHNWRVPGARFSYGVELQTVGQFGGQYHLEFNVPVFFRYHTRDRFPVLRSLAFGIGPSYATKPPQYEIDSRGDSQQFLAYWALEAEFGAADMRSSLFTRLHHRSGAFGTIANEGASNVVVLGWRRRW